MNFKIKFYRKLFSLISFISIFFQSFAPYLAVATPIYAQETVQESVEENTQENIVENSQEEINEEIGTEQIEEFTTPATEELIPTPTVIENIDLKELVEPKNVDTSANLIINLTSIPVEDVVEQECIVQDQEIVLTSNNDWNIDLDKNSSETKEKVQLGVKYVFPQENNVTVTFNCLPKDESLRTPLKVEQIKLSDLELPDEVNPYGEYAYDVTTGMADGTFEYDLTLPKPENQVVEISYMEDVNSEVKNIDVGKINQEGNTVKAENLNHFTIFIVVSPNETANDDSVTNEDNAWISDNQYARFNSSSDLAEYGFPNLNIPTDSVIEGIEVFVEGYKSGGNRNLNIAIWNKSNSSPDAFTSSKLATLTGSDSIHKLGDPTEKWGKTWKSSDFDSDFRVRVGTTSGGGDAYLDHIQVKVYYTEPGPLFTPPTLSYNDADDYALTSVTGIWTATSGGSNITGLNTEEVKWGTSSGYGQSGLRFDGSGLQSFNEGNSFYLGALTHFNWPIYNAANGATLKITLQFLRPGITPNPQFTFDFDIEETPNTSGNCPSWQQSSIPCDDKITFPSSYGQESFTIGDKLYTLKILGFVNSYPSGSPMSEFITEEHKNNTAFLVGTLSSVLVEAPQLTLVEKAVNGEDADNSPGPELAVGSAVNWTYNVQNTGNVALTDVTVIDSQGESVTCPKTTLEPGENMVCNASGTAIIGQYTNSAYVQGKHGNNTITSNNEVANYFGVFSEVKVNLCHATPAEANPYNLINVSINSVSQCENVNGHGNHNDDIIPPYNYGTCSYSGKNWDTNGQAIWNNNCITPKGTIIAHKFADFDKNEIQDSGEPNIQYFEMSLYQGSGCNGTLINQLTTGSDGNASFSNLDYGNYSVKETIPAPGLPGLGWWENITPLCQNVTLDSQSKQVNFANFKVQQLTVCKYNDKNGDGLFQSGENGLSGWTINLSGPENLSGVTGGDGCVRIPINIYGSYLVTEVLKPGWIQTFPSQPQTGTVTYNTSMGLTLRNFQLGTISGQKFNDLDNDGVKDADEPGLPGWTIKLDKNADGSYEATTVTDADGNYRFSDLVYGTYRVREQAQTGWTQTTTNPADILIQSGTNLTNINFGNYRNPITIKAHKIVCDSETDLPNWGDNASGVVNATTAEDFVTNSNGQCRFVSDWDFEWGFDGAAPKPQPDYYGYSGAPWSSFDSKTTSTEPAVLTINDLEGKTRIWFKEVLQTDYIPFTYYSGSGVGSNVSAEFYCHDDHYKYDNYEAINNPQYGQTYYCVAINAPSTGIIQVHKFNDPNFNGTIDGNESGIENWKFTLYSGSDCVSGSEVDGATGLTDNKGDLEFTNLSAGDYSVRETPQLGWDNSTNLCQNVSVVAGQTSSLNFGNFELGKIIVDKVTTPSGDPTEFEFTLDAQNPEWGDKIFRLSDQSPVEETWLKPGIYSVSETADASWNSRVECYTDELDSEIGNDLGVRDFRIISEVQAQVPQNTVDPNAISLDPGETITCTFYNDYIPGELTIQKFNNLWPVDQTAGAVINFTITVKASKNSVKDVKVVDLMPEGFEFNNEWKVMKNGSEDITSQVSNPNYASPGEWNLGDMKDGEEIVITFPATISDDQDPGTYKDLAYAYGCETRQVVADNSEAVAVSGNLSTCEITDDAAVVASSVISGKADDGVITDQFVGTQVTLVKDLQDSKSYDVEKEEERIGEVLGASTSLPGTGANSLLTYLVWTLLFSSFSSLLILLWRKAKFGLLTALFLLAIFKVDSALAITYQSPSLRIENPKSPTNVNTFDIVYTTMDLYGNDITAKCFKKGPTEGSYSQFGATKTFAGGGSGICAVNSAIMNNSGTYLFKVEVVSSSGNTSDSVTVDYGSSSLPETPVEYDKDKIEDCKYRIKGKSADDGKTVKVELYRSDKLEFKADGGSRVHTFNVGPNTSFELDNSVPHCDRDYYYALRAFDAYGNGSDLIGDRDIKVTYSESTTETAQTTQEEAIVVEGGAGIPAEGAAAEGEATEGEVLSEEEKAAKEKAEKEAEVVDGEVLGVKAAKTAWDRALTFAKENPLTSLIIIGGLGIILYVAGKAYKSRKQS